MRPEDCQRALRPGVDICLDHSLRIESVEPALRDRDIVLVFQDVVGCNHREEPLSLLGLHPPDTGRVNAVGLEKKWAFAGYLRINPPCVQAVEGICNERAVHKSPAQ